MEISKTGKTQTDGKGMRKIPLLSGIRASRRTSRQPTRRLRSAARSSGGAALIIVLTCLVLIAGLAIGLLNHVESDRTSAASYRGGASTHDLAEYAVNVVMTQINSATTGANAGNGWASQPGALRVFDNRGNLLNIYKLYSSPQMVTGTFPSSDTTPNGWDKSPSVYTDLNDPVVSKINSTQTYTNYPILDPGATNSVGGVQGFSIAGNVPLAAKGPANPAPMPVSWLYVLQDGTLVAPAANSSNAVVSGATSNNPITGRIAFWADDDTSKININTAAGAPWDFTNTSYNISSTLPLPANYWDIPVVGSVQDSNLAVSQPWSGEYQRYPGHPATVSLSAVFTNLTTNDIMTIAPRITYKKGALPVGSQWGRTVTIIPGSKIPSDAARLYANVDELLFTVDRAMTNGPITPAAIERGRFFLTASSRAPDVTPFNTPRITCWPVTYPVISQKIYDQLIAFCGTVGGPNPPVIGPNSTNAYYFLRTNAYSSTGDITLKRNQQLLAYLRKMTTIPVPGFATDSKALGLGILGKYSANGAEAKQLSTEIFDYIRCINLEDNSLGAGVLSNYYSTNGFVVPSVDTATATRGLGRMPMVTKAGLIFWYDTNSPTPRSYSYSITTNIAATLRTNTATNISIDCRLVLETFVPSLGYPMMTNNGFSNVVTGLRNGGAGGTFKWGPSPNSTTNIFPNDKAIYDEERNAFLAINKIGGRRGIQIYFNYTTKSSDPKNLPNAYGTNSPWFESVHYNYSGGYLTNTNTGLGYNTGPMTVTSGSGSFTWGSNPPLSVPAASWIYVHPTNNPTQSATPGTFYFSGPANGANPLTISSYYNGVLVQTISGLNFPSLTNPLPLPRQNQSYNPNRDPNGPHAWDGANSPRVKNWEQNGNFLVITSNDVVRSVEMVSADYRVDGADATVLGSRCFAPHPGYFTYTNQSNAYMAHTFVGRDEGALLGATMIADGYYNFTNNTLFHATNTIYTAPQGWPTGEMTTRTSSNNAGVAIPNLGQWGDFDNGYGYHADGPYLGFADEGVTSIDNTIPYFSTSTNNDRVSPGFFSPNRLVPSAGIMGSLPTGVTSQRGWRTLLFRPLALTKSGHPGSVSPPDYLLLDLFKMPVIEPYAISEPLSTAGQINMNYQILPFTWLHRSTAVQAALHTERVTAIPNPTPKPIGLSYKKMLSAGITTPTRFPINVNTNNGTLAAFEARFAANDIFRSASEICSIPLVPQSPTVVGITAANTNSINTVMNAWWQGYAYTGENSKERPYARIYPKLTTKSNTYTVHYRVESLKKSPNGDPTIWTEGKDKVLATFRGSTTIERFVNPRNPKIPDYTGVPLPLTDTYALPYQFRIIGQRQFSP